MSYRVDAPAKLNLCLYLGPTRDDGLHEIVSLFDSISLHDTLSLEGIRDHASEDRVVCPGVDGENLVKRALSICRERGLLDGQAIEITIEKRIPVAAGLGGGSADAAAVLRLIAEIYDRDLHAFEEIAFALGADVPSQLRPGASLVQGAGERVVALDPRCLQAAGRAYVIIAQRDGLSTGEVFAQADLAGLPETDITDREDRLVEALSSGIDLPALCEVIDNALEPAILAMRPELAPLPDALRLAGAGAVAFTGSGPTCFGVFDSSDAAKLAAKALGDDGHQTYLAVPVEAEFGLPRKIADEN